jgi:hypothetical protein
MHNYTCGCKEKGTENQCPECGDYAIDWAGVDFQEALCKTLEDLPFDKSMIHGEADEGCLGCDYLRSEEE